MHPDRDMMGMGGGTPEKGQGLPRWSGVLASLRDPRHDARGSLTALGTRRRALHSHLQQPQSEVNARHGGNPGPCGEGSWGMLAPLVGECAHCLGHPPRAGAVSRASLCCAHWWSSSQRQQGSSKPETRASRHRYGLKPCAFTHHVRKRLWAASLRDPRRVLGQATASRQHHRC